MPSRNRPLRESGPCSVVDLLKLHDAPNEAIRVVPRGEPLKPIISRLRQCHGWRWSLRCMQRNALEGLGGGGAQRSPPDPAASSICSFLCLNNNCTKPRPRLHCCGQLLCCLKAEGCSHHQSRCNCVITATSASRAAPLQLRNITDFSTTPGG